jgi:AcrR family transcriptional regulator
VGRNAFDLDADQIVDAALVILRERGLEAVSMRSVSAALGVSPVPLYKRIGNKDALLAAMASRLLGDVAPKPRAREPWQRYALRWATAIRAALVSTPDIRMLMRESRAPFVESSRPLVDELRAAGFASDEAVQAARLLIWATAGHVVLESGRDNTPEPARRGRRPGGDPSGVSRREAEQLFGIHVQYLLDGIEREHTASHGRTSP